MDIEPSTYRKKVYIAYLILFCIMLNLAFRIYLDMDFINKLSINLKMDKINEDINKLINQNFIYEDGIINVYILINFVIFFFIGFIYENYYLIVLIILILSELLIIYSNGSGKIVFNTTLFLLAYALGSIIKIEQKRAKEENV